MAIVGAFARIDADHAEACRWSLDELPGVSTFDLPETGKLGVLVEADSLDNAHAIVTTTIRSTPGVLGVWPVYANTEDEHNSDEPTTPPPSRPGRSQEGKTP